MAEPSGTKRRRGARAEEASPGGGAQPPRRTHSEDLLHQLESEILSGKLPPGARLEEQALAARFNVSRTPVREALWHLASSGLVQIRPHQGAIVTQLTVTELLEMFQVMAELEELAAQLAARRMKTDERVKLRATHKQCSACAEGSDEDGFFEGNTRFHDAIFVGARNKFLLHQLRDLRRRLNPYRRMLTHQPGVMMKSIEEHETVLSSIEKGDGPAAHALMREHLNMLGAEACDFVAALSHLGAATEPFPFEPAATAGGSSR